MTCCGRKRAMMYGAAPTRTTGAMGTTSAQAATPPVQAMTMADALFEYTGDTGVSAIGGVTRRLYRFEGKHARVAVDARDAPSMGLVPVLRRVA